MTETDKRTWIAAVLTNDEVSTDEAMAAYFMREGGLREAQAISAVSKRGIYQRVGYATYGGWL